MTCVVFINEDNPHLTSWFCRDELDPITHSWDNNQSLVRSIVLGFPPHIVEIAFSFDIFLPENGPEEAEDSGEENEGHTPFDNNFEEDYVEVREED